MSGDSALLMPLLYDAQNKTKKHEICLVLHYIDNTRKILSHIPQFFHIMNIGKAHVERFIDELVTCGKVISTSLHGIIATHSYGIPGTKYIAYQSN